MDHRQSDEWDVYFERRSSLRNETADAHSAAFLAAHRYEVFLGPPTKRVRDREPAFVTLEEARRWARGRSDGGEWQVRDSLTGKLVFLSRDEDDAIRVSVQPGSHQPST